MLQILSIGWGQIEEVWYERVSVEVGEDFAIKRLHLGPKQLGPELKLTNLSKSCLLLPTWVVLYLTATENLLTL